jgi:hypothetical protein
MSENTFEWQYNVFPAEVWCARCGMSMPYIDRFEYGEDGLLEHMSGRTCRCTNRDCPNYGIPLRVPMTPLLPAQKSGEVVPRLTQTGYKLDHTQVPLTWEVYIPGIEVKDINITMTSDNKVFWQIQDFEWECHLGPEYDHESLGFSYDGVLLLVRVYLHEDFVGTPSESPQ